MLRYKLVEENSMGGPEIYESMELPWLTCDAESRELVLPAVGAGANWQRGGFRIHFRTSAN